LTTWHCILSAELTKKTLDCFFGDFLSAIKFMNISSSQAH